MEESSSSANKTTAASVPSVVPASMPVSAKKIRPINISKRDLFLLSAVAVIFLIITFFIFVLPPSQKTVGLDLFKSKNLAFSVPGSKGRFDELVKSAFGAKDQKEASDLFVKAYFLLKSDYELFPAEGKRNSLVLLKDYWTKHYPQEAAKLQLIIPCRQESCGAKFVYGKDLTDLKKAIDDSKELGLEFKHSIYIGLENAAKGEGAGDSNLKYAGLSGVLANLKSALGGKKSAGIEALIKKTEDILQKVDPERLKASTNSARVNLAK